VELLDRYLKAVALWLPRAQAPDIVAELRADIQSEIDDHRDGRGRGLTREEEEAILTRWGHPMLVASRYQPQQSLIGPTLLPAYKTVLKVLLLVYCLPWLLAWVVLSIVQPSWLATTPELATLKPLLVNTLFLFALVTIGFAATERAYRRSRALETWTARQLTDPESGRDWRDIPRTGSTIELAIGLAVLAWWSGLAGSPSTYDLGSVIRVTWIPLERNFYFAVLGLMSASVAMAALNLVHPRWTLARLGMQVGLDAIGLGLVCLLLPTTVLQVTAGSTVDVEQAALMARWVNVSWSVSLIVAGVILALRLIAGVRRLGRVNRPTPAAARLA
jgi:hypothetical protein